LKLNTFGFELRGDRDKVSHAPRQSFELDYH